MRSLWKHCWVAVCLLVAIALPVGWSFACFEVGKKVGQTQGKAEGFGQGMTAQPAADACALQKARAEAALWERLYKESLTGKVALEVIEHPQK